MTVSEQTLCLTMIVKDEAHVIRRCLASVRPLITHWSIVDTGSTDGTQEIIRETLADLPGALHERPWRDFGANRTESVRLAENRADYLMVIDADEELVIEPGFVMPALLADIYETRHRVGREGFTFYLPQFIRTGLPWRYDGLVHEYLTCDEPHQITNLPGLLVLGHFDSARNQVDKRTKYLADAALLEQALDTDPEESRSVFYLAQSYRDAGEPGRAIALYETRATMGGWGEEVWFALFEAARLRLAVGDDIAVVTRALMRAYNCRPTRAEAPTLLAQIHRLRGEYNAAYLFAAAAAALPLPADRLFLDPVVYQWRALDEQAVAASWTNRYREAIAINTRLLNCPDLPPADRKRILGNRKLCLEQLDQAGVVRAEADTEADADERKSDAPPATAQAEAPPLRVAVVTPYYQEADDVLNQCHRSVSRQSYGVTHYLVADGFPNPMVAHWDARHMVLPHAHRDNGNTPRMLGALSALSAGFDAIAFLDADNWLAPDHIARLLALHRRTGAAVCTSGRWITRLDGSRMFIDGESDGGAFADTSTLLLTGRALELVPLWGTMPRQAGPVGDRIFWQAIRNRNVPCAHDPEPTLYFRSQYAVHYQMLKESPPQAAKNVEEVDTTFAWLRETGDNILSWRRYLQPEP